jgi:WD40 repeat protein
MQPEIPVPDLPELVWQTIAQSLIPHDLRSLGLGNKTIREYVKPISIYGPIKMIQEIANPDKYPMRIMSFLKDGSCVWSPNSFQSNFYCKTGIRGGSFSHIGDDDETIISLAASASYIACLCRKDNPEKNHAYIKLADINSGCLCRSFFVNTSEAVMVNCIAITFNNRYILCGRQEGSIDVLSAEQGEYLFKTKAHVGGVTSLSILHNGYVISSGVDLQIKIWKPVKSGLQCVQTILLPDAWNKNNTQWLEFVKRILVNHSDNTIITITNNGRAILWDRDTSKEQWF